MIKLEFTLDEGERPVASTPARSLVAIGDGRNLAYRSEPTSDL